MSSLSRLLLGGFLLSTLLAASCSSCESCGASQDSTTTEEADTTEQAEPDVTEDTYAEKLEEATENAKVLGDQAAFDRVTKARFMAAELEGMQKQEVEAPKVKTAPKPKYNDDGQLDVGALKTVFRNNQGTLRKCYERALKGDPALQGKVVLTVRIGDGGKALMAKARSQDIANRTVLSCMERAAKGWSYPAPSGGTVIVNKTFGFTPQN